MRIQRVEPYLTFAMSISLFSGCSLGMVMMSFPLAFDRWAVDASGRTYGRTGLLSNGIDYIRSGCNGWVQSGYQCEAEIITALLQLQEIYAAIVPLWIAPLVLSL